MNIGLNIVIAEIDHWIVIPIQIYSAILGSVIIPIETAKLRIRYIIVGIRRKGTLSLQRDVVRLGGVPDPACETQS